MVDVRRLSPQEWRLLRQVRLRALEDAPYAFGSTFSEESEHSDDWWMKSVRNLAWFVADEHDGEPVGLAAGIPPGEEWNPHDCPEIISMWVQPSHRGTGVAVALLKAVISWAASEGASEVSLGVADGNEQARRFYERAGFIPTGASQPLRSRPQVCTRQMLLTIRDTSV